MRKELAEKLELKLYVSRRINDGGAKIEPNSRDGLAHPEGRDPRDIVSLFRESCRPELRDALVKRMEKFEEEFFNFVDGVQERKMSPPRPVANCGILVRNVHFYSGTKSAYAKEWFGLATVTSQSLNITSDHLMCFIPQVRQARGGRVRKQMGSATSISKSKRQHLTQERSIHRVCDTYRILGQAIRKRRRKQKCNDEIQYFC